MQEQTRPEGPRAIAIVGPFQSGKTTLLESILARLGALPRQGSVVAGSSLGDGSAEARAHQMSVELNIAGADFLGDHYSFVDCPGAIEFLTEMQPVLPVVDAAIVVCDGDEKKLPALQLILRELESRNIPRLLFLNKVDALPRPAKEIVDLLQAASRTPLLLRHMPIYTDGAVSGFVDLALERAFAYREQARSEVVDMPNDVVGEEHERRFAMLERLSEHDDALVEALVEEVEPDRRRVFDDLRHELQDGLSVPVLIGSALHGNGMERLMKALRHEVGTVSATAQRLGLDAKGQVVASVIKTLNTTHAGKLSVVRLLAGTAEDGATVTASSGASVRISGIVRLLGQATHKLKQAGAGDVVAFGRLEGVKTSDTLWTGNAAVPALVPPATQPPVFALAVRARRREDDVKLGLAIRKVAEEDPSLTLDTDPERGTLILRGQGDLHLRVAVERLASKYGIAVTTEPARVAYRETIRKAVSGIRGRHKKQSGGHGQFGDVVIDTAPLPRGAGVQFEERIVGGAVPRQYIPSVEEGVRTALRKGPLGFPVVDVKVTLMDGSFHTVDSSDMAFQLAGRLAMAEALPRCAPVLLEPVLAVKIMAPAEATARTQTVVSSRRGQILGYDARDGWPGWDVVEALLPEKEITDLIVELRSLTAGVGTYVASFDHLAELVGREADQVVAAQGATV